ncbi:hypothetical protein HNQ91_003905 [Filimonas zeae]|nr:hypothetical protein [Filimonas zeae]
MTSGKMTLTKWLYISHFFYAFLFFNIFPALRKQNRFGFVSEIKLLPFCFGSIFGENTDVITEALMR